MLRGIAREWWPVSSEVPLASKLLPRFASAVQVVIRHLFVSPGHNFRGHHGGPAGSHPTVGVEAITCRAGHGIEGDRYFDYRDDFKGQVSFLAWEVYLALIREFAVPALSPGALRRNAVLEGADLPALIGRQFSLGGVEFLGMEECRPCYWMDGAVAPGAEAWLLGRGGLRAKILTDGLLRTGATELRVHAPVTA